MSFNKLVRDKIPEIIISKGQKPDTKILNDEEYKKELDIKLQEELQEYLVDQNIEELADLVEVVYAILAYKNVSIKDFEKIRLEKQEKRGSFNKRIYLKTVEVKASWGSNP